MIKTIGTPLQTIVKSIFSQFFETFPWNRSPWVIDNKSIVLPEKSEKYVISENAG